MQLAPTYKDKGGFTMNEMSEKEILEKINSILETAKIIAENNVDMDDFEMEIDVPEKLQMGKLSPSKERDDSCD